VSEHPKRGIVASVESDATALARIAEGDLSALGVLYDRHYLAVLRFVQRVLRGNHEAEDVCQETFLTASRVAGAFDGRSSCRPWLYGIASRLMLQRGRGAARLARFLARVTAHAVEPTPPSPHELLLRNELQDGLSRALDALATDKRVVLILAEVEGLSCAEIAQALSIPLGTVWTRLHHARRALRKQLARHLP
jgi:RNA polymerase sigma factor (sigma-70 family)